SFANCCRLRFSGITTIANCPLGCGPASRSKEYCPYPLPKIRRGRLFATPHRRAPMTDSARPHNDAPITQPGEDRFGIDPFAQNLAASIRSMKSPEGTVIALNGPWGSGKSSVVNLILHHLKGAVENDEIVAINFACWWFRGEEALALAFFRELYAALSPSLG